MERPDTLTRFIDAARQAALASTEPGSAAETAAKRIFSALETPAEVAEGKPSAQLSAYAHLPDSLCNANAGPAPIKTLSEALGALAPSLSWQRRPNAESRGERFYNARRSESPQANRASGSAR